MSNAVRAEIHHVLYPAASRLHYFANSASYKQHQEPLDKEGLINIIPPTIHHPNPNSYVRYHLRGPDYYSRYYRMVEKDRAVVDIVDGLDIQMPDEIHIRGMNYPDWRKYQAFRYEPSVIRSILDRCVIRVKPKTFDLVSLIRKRPAFWRSLFWIIQDISGYHNGSDKQEKQLADRIRRAGLRYSSGLEGALDLFVWENTQNRPDIWQYYRELDYHDRIEFIAFLQFSTQVDVMERLEQVRRGFRQKLRLTPERPQDVPKDFKEKTGIPPESLWESQNQLREAVRRERKRPRTRRVRTGNENIEFNQAGL